MNNLKSVHKSNDLKTQLITFISYHALLQSHLFLEFTPLLSKQFLSMNLQINATFYGGAICERDLLIVKLVHFLCQNYFLFFQANCNLFQ